MLLLINAMFVITCLVETMTWSLPLVSTIVLFEASARSCNYSQIMSTTIKIVKIANRKVQVNCVRPSAISMRYSMVPKTSPVGKTYQL